VNMGDVVRNEAAKRCLDMSDSSLGEFMIKLREEFGPAVVAELCLKDLLNSEHNMVVVDGIRNILEVKLFKKYFRVKLLAIHASPKTRFNFLKDRRREDFPISCEAFEARDRRELKIGLGEVIALSDEIISNNNVSKDKLELMVFKIIRSWINEIEDRTF